MPAIETAADAAKAMGAIMAAVAFTPVEASGIARLVEVYAKTLELSEFEARLRALEEKGRSAKERE